MWVAHFCIVGQKGQKWVKLCKLPVFMLKPITVWLKYHEIVQTCLFVFKNEYKFETSIMLISTMGIWVKKAQKRQKVSQI